MDAHTVKEQKEFLKIMINLYKDHECLWHQDHIHYRHHNIRQEAMNNIVAECRKYCPETDEEFVKLKISNMRNSFRKEYRRVLNSRKSAKNKNDIHKPNLWYYSLFLFTAGEECKEENEIKIENKRVIHEPEQPVAWNKKYIGLLIKLVKKESCLYDSKPYRYSKLVRRKLAYKHVTEQLSKITGKHFSVPAVIKRFQSLRCQFTKEYRKVRTADCKGFKYKPLWWCYGMLEFLIPNLSMKSLQIINKQHGTDNKCDAQVEHNSEDSENESSQNSDDINNYSNNKDCLDSITSPNVNVDEMDSVVSTITVNSDNDIFDTIGRNIAYQLRHMSEKQRKIAERLMKDVMYYGQMEELSDTSSLNVDLSCQLCNS